MRKTTLLAMMLLVATTAAFAQVRTPRPSPKATLSQTVGLTDITLTYSRPGVKGRTIWGGLVPYDKVWRTGANEATTINFSDDVWINGNKLAKGMYSLHTIPGQNEWTVIFNSVADQWGSYSYDEAKDALRVKVKPETAPHAEWMGFEVPEMTTDTAKIVLRWEKVAVPFTVDTKSTERTMTAFRNAMQPDWRTPYLAANFAFDNKCLATDQQISDWLDQSLRINENIGNLWLKARFLERLGKRAEAIKAGEQAIAAARADQADFAAEVRRNVDNWKK
jgi:hypothetical protein